MGKRIWFFAVILIMIVSTGCGLIPAAPTQDTGVTLSDSELATLYALATQANKPPEIILPPATETPTVEAPVVLPTSTPLPGSIAITSITQKEENTALITWDVTGEFPSGFKVVWSDQQGLPTYPESNSVSAGSSTARSVLITITPGTIYYVRVCRFLYDVCDVYSELQIFAFMPYTPTPDLNPANTATAAALQKTATAAAVKTASGGSSSGGSSTGGSSNIVITWMAGNKGGQAYIEWTDSSGSSSGYRIVYSTSSPTPTYGTNSTSYFVVSDPKARFAYLDGKSNTKYYYRVCRLTKDGCGSYSNTYTYTFP